jgi:hypothetical protein
MFMACCDTPAHASRTSVCCMRRMDRQRDGGRRRGFATYLYTHTPGHIVKS